MSEYDEYNDAHDRKQGRGKHSDKNRGGKDDCAERIAIPVVLLACMLLTRAVLRARPRKGT
jgi:hypothetical protein